MFESFKTLLFSLSNCMTYIHIQFHNKHTTIILNINVFNVKVILCAYEHIFLNNFKQILYMY